MAQLHAYGALAALLERFSRPCSAGEQLASTLALRVDPQRCVTTEATCVAAPHSSTAVLIQLNPQKQSGPNASSAHLPSLDGPWNLSTYASVTFSVRNLEDHAVVVFGRLDGHLFGAQAAVFLGPNATEELIIHMDREKPFPHNLSDRFGMNGVPGGVVSGWDVAQADNVSAIWIDVAPPGPTDRPAKRLTKVRTWRKLHNEYDRTRAGSHALP